ncbi:MAG: PAS domain-containing protein [Phototrophicaceae bacterium]
MTDSIDIRDETLRLLQTRAQQAGCSADELLQRLFKDDHPAALPPDIYHQLLEQTSDIISLFDLNLRYVYINPMLSRLLGVDARDMIGRTDSELGVPDAQTARWRELWQRVIDTGEEQLTRFTYPTTKGTQHLESRLTPIYAQDGTLRYLLAITRNMTEHWQAEENARRNHDVLQRILDNSHFLLAYMDADFNFIQVNERYARADNKTPDYFIGRNHFDLYPNAENEAIFRRVVETGKPITIYAKPFEYAHNRERGISYWDWSLVPIHDSKHRTVTAVVFTLIDVTERVEAEQRLFDSQRLVSSVLLAVPNYIFIYDLTEQRIVFANAGVTRVLGLSVDELLAIGSDALLDLAHPEDQAALRQQLGATAQAGQDDSVYRTTARLKHKDGDWRWVEIQSVVFKRSATGQVEQLVGSVIDISRQKQSEAIALENVRLKARFQKEQERNALVQRIISALSHDLRTPLTIISSSREMLSRYHDRMTAGERMKKLNTIGRQVQFALELLDDTVNMTRGNLTGVVFQPAPVNIAALCQVSVGEIQTADEFRHHIKFINLNGTETVAVDEVLVSRILLNLLSNAIKYSPAGSEIRLELNQRPGWIVLQVIDQGMGIREADLPHIFDPFYRTANAAAISGTGLGLSIVKDCVKRHNGHIEVASEPGQGSTFTVMLPYKRGASDEARGATAGLQSGSY